MIARVLPFGGSDHWPIQLEVQGMGTPKNRPFIFENIWLSHPDFISNIANWWAEDLNIQGSRMFLLQKKLKHIKLRLKYWNRNEYGNIFEAKKSIEGKMQVFNQPLITDSFDKDKSDQRHSKEAISDREESIRVLIRHIPRLVSSEDNFNLNRPVTEEEVSEVLKEMQNGKVPSLDGFNVDFFKACQSIVKQDILDIVQDSRRNKTILKVLNISFISLIQKQDLAQTPDRFRPIALCNVVYKIISKLVANRLKPLLPSLVSVEQSGYVEGRQILDNIIQAHEVVHSLSNNRKAGMIMQLDIEKDYDKLN
eukprot:PITA_10316